MSVYGQTLPNGTYNVANQSSGLLWDDPGSSTQSLTHVDLWSNNGGGANQQWRFALQSDGYYQILNQASGLALNNPGSSTAAGTRLIQYAWLPVTPNAEWSVKPAPIGGGWIVTNRQSGLVVGPAGNTQNTNIDQETHAGTAAQVWTIGNCAAGAITPYISTPANGWQSVAAVHVNSISGINLGPQPMTGTWSWTGPNGFRKNTREIDNIPLTAGKTNYFVATYKSASGCTSTETFAISIGTAPTLSIQPIASQTYPEAAFTLSASSNSPGAITFSVVSGPATISGDQLTVVSGGSVVVQATQAASSGYDAATATTGFNVSTAMSKTLTFSKTGSAASIGPASDSPNFNFLDSNGQFFLQNAYSQYDTTPGDHIWDFYTGANALDSSLALSSGNSQYNTQTLCTTDSPVYTDYYTNTGQSPGPGAYADGNFCDAIGVWVDPDTGNWYGIVHNEIYPNSYRVDALSYAVSTDHGATWSQKTPIATSAYGISDSSVPYHDYGDGDPRLLVDTASGYFYVMYLTRVQDVNDASHNFWTRIMRAPISQKFATTSWQKYYNGGWTQSAGIVWVCDAYETTCAQGLTAANLESNIGPDGDPTKAEQVKWPASARSADDLSGFTNPLLGLQLSWNVYLQSYITAGFDGTNINFYTTPDLVSEAWTYAGSAPYAASGPWYTWMLDAGNQSSAQVTGKSFYEFCVIDCSTYDSEYTPFSVSLNSGTTVPAYYTGYNGVTSSTNTYVITHANNPSTTATAASRWTFVPVGDGFFYVKQGSQYLQVADGDTGREWGALVSLAAPMASGMSAPELSRQQWRFEKITAIGGVTPSVPQYRLINRYSNSALSFTSTVFDSGYFGLAVTAPMRDWDPSAGSTYSSWHAADQELIFIAQ
ncbi:RICIN domain-containing protein [Dyella silvatica]|uniref:RICIN domain-containing protein n=1 Tax=Dyella silvatica TaxID=2992128 RepID=UPI0022514DEF|nr:RICIN domain-containing protein [Dyella silvatica]